MNVIGGLLRIKQIRESSRESEMRRARHRLELSQQELHRAKEFLREHTRMRDERERALYSDVCSRLVVVRDLEDLGYEMSCMRDEAKQDEEKVTVANSERDVKREEMTVATQAYQQAAQATQKFVNLAHEERAAQDLEAERLADLELEEHPVRSGSLVDLDDVTAGEEA